MVLKKINVGNISLQAAYFVTLPDKIILVQFYWNRITFTPLSSTFKFHLLTLWQYNLNLGRADASRTDLENHWVDCYGSNTTGLAVT